MIRLVNEYLELRAVLMPWHGRWYLMDEGPDGKPIFTDLGRIYKQPSTIS